ncbi:MAG: dUTP diphosphatase [Thiohalorhabdus sp.]|uniref:dUTP diphosphatase n=1 Tax=Thiohalorhabdus sp. TaxID=3094134 RepID=UPI00398142DC
MDQSPLQVPITRLDHARDLPLPGYASEHASGVDLLAALEEPLTLASGERALVPAGIAVALPPGFEAQVRPRSGLAAKQGVTVLNTPGTIDADYRGEIKVVLINLGGEAVTLQRGDRVAQLVVAPVTRVAWEPRENLDETVRGGGGFGSTGVGSGV